MEKPFSNHWEAAKRILRYVRGTLDHGIFYEANIPINLVGYIDSDVAGSMDDSKSISGYIFNLGSGAISWSSKKQPIVTLSTTKAKYIATSISGVIYFGYVVIQFFMGELVDMKYCKSED
ncbi:secreted RxLR effector protein 161-like [Tripterygium wilfordii]|uniref:secreted RxLR effector protein 161-like n=1 Tax=Tripterygium wilfordii TaxID=458696 RepID=UPI0018F857E5|nr:secreted RxLR effector protein 161-like [Tripterygium wilfordii]